MANSNTRNRIPGTGAAAQCEDSDCTRDSDSSSCCGGPLPSLRGLEQLSTRRRGGGARHASVREPRSDAGARLRGWRVEDGGRSALRLRVEPRA
eukprot:2479893-Rhodomonas_salina.1